MNISEKGLNLIKKFEGCRLTAYKCPAGVLTIGWGHTGDVKQGQKITQKQADDMLKQDMKKYETPVNNLKLNINQNQFDALVSFCYNCGSGNLNKLVKGRTIEQIGNALLLYNKANGVILPGLSKRRIAERELYFTPCGKMYKVTTKALNIRAGGAINFRVVDVLKQNDIVEVTQVSSSGWGKISNGWINLKYTVFI